MEAKKLLGTGNFPLLEYQADLDLGESLLRLGENGNARDLLDRLHASAVENEQYTVAIASLMLLSEIDLTDGKIEDAITKLSEATRIIEDCAHRSPPSEFG